MGNNIKILSIDPSGEYSRSKGKSGFAIGEYDKQIKYPKILLTKTIDAKNHSSKKDYYDTHLEFLKVCHNHWEKLIVVIEDFKIRPSQTHYSDGGETLQLIALLKRFCEDNDIEYHMQNPGQVKPRWKNQVLQNLGFLKNRPYISFLINDFWNRVNKHELDAIRHLYHLSVCNKYFTH